MRLFAITLTLLVLSATAAVAQDWERFYLEADERTAEMLVRVLDPTVPRGGAGRYVYMPLRDLLAGLGVFDARYVAVAPGGQAAPTFSAEDLLAGASRSGIAEGIKAPAPGGDGRVWVAAAAPAAAVSARPYLSVGSVNGANHAELFIRQASDVVIDGRGYAVWVRSYPAARVRTGYVFFDAAATVP